MPDKPGDETESVESTIAYIEEIAKKKDRFLALVGTIITEWALVDEELFRFVRFALNTSDEKTA